MTICIAALAENAQAIVLVADKALTYGDNVYTPAMSDDTGVRKILPVGDSDWMVLTSGSVGHCDRVVRLAADKISQRLEIAGSATEVARCFESVYDEVYTEVVERSVLRPNLLSKKLWAARSRKLLPISDQIVNKVSEQLDRFSFSCSLLVCGFDSSGGANIILIDAPGVATNQTNSGYSVIGNGWQVALGRLLWQKVERKDRLEEALYEVFDAKAHAEQIQGVGFAWDARIMLRGRVETPPKKITKLIETVWDRATDSPFDAKPTKAPKDWQKTLRGYARSVMKKK